MITPETSPFNASRRTPAYEEAVRLLSALSFRDRQAAFAEAHALEAAAALSEGLKRQQKPAFWGDLVGLQPDPSEERLGPGDDHVATWLRNGQPALFTSEPYELSLPALKNIVARCEEHRLTATVSGESAHYPGRTLLVQYRRRGDVG